MITTHFILFNIYLACWLGLYLILFKKNTGFKMNRIVLLAGIMVAFILPLVHIHWTSYYHAAGASALLPVVPSANEISVLSSASSSRYATPFPVWKTIEVIYWCGVMVMSFLFIQKIVQLFFLIKKLPHHVEKGYVRIITGSNRETFSFGKYLFAPADIPPAIYQHELVHIRGHHTLDNLLLEIVKICCWFNPIVYGYQSVLRTLHEYIADSVVTRSFEKDDYVRLLASHAFYISQVAFTNHFFNRSQLQKRLIMLQKQSFPGKAGRKYLPVIALIAALILISTSSFTLKNKVKDMISKLAPSGQQLDVKGVVTDQDGNPIAKATVLVFGHRKGAITDSKGRFELNNITEGGLLTISMIGYSTIDVKINSAKHLHIILYQKPAHLRELMVVGLTEGQIKPVINKTNEPAVAFVEQMPDYPGGKDALIKFLHDNIMYPQEARKEGLQGTVIVSFMVDKDGSLSQIHTVNDTVGGGLEQEAVRLIKAMPKWIPGHQNGEAEAVPYTLPILFILQN